jgi:hypothetical protein
MNERRYDDAFELSSDDLEWWLAGDDSIASQKVSGTVNKAEFTNAMGQVMDPAVAGVTFDPGLILVEDNKLAMTIESRAELKNGPCGSILFVPNVTRDRVEPGTRCAVDHTRSRRNTGTNLPAYAFDPVTKLCCRR